MTSYFVKSNKRKSEIFPKFAAKSDKRCKINSENNIYYVEITSVESDSEKEVRSINEEIPKQKNPKKMPKLIMLAEIPIIL